MVLTTITDLPTTLMFYFCGTEKMFCGRVGRESDLFYTDLGNNMDGPRLQNILQFFTVAYTYGYLYKMEALIITEFLGPLLDP